MKNEERKMQDPQEKHPQPPYKFLLNFGVTFLKLVLYNEFENQKREAFD